MDSLSGMDVRLNETEGGGEVQQEGYTNVGESFGGDFFSDMQAIEYNPFKEEDEGRETYLDDAEVTGTEEYLPADSAGIPDVLPGEEAQSVEETGGQYVGGQDAGELEDLQEGDGPEESEDPEVPEDSEDDSEAPDDLGEESEESEEKAHTDGKSEETRRADEAAAEERRRAEHEASEAKRKAEWEARQQEKREALKAEMERIRAMSDEELAAQSMKRVEADTEKLTRRNMKECVSEYIQTACLEDAEFARQAMLPQKNMVRCFQYINRKAYEYVQDEIKASGIQPGWDNTCYASDVPDDLCYHWAEEYFRTMDVKEDKEEEEKFVPKPYVGRAASSPKGKKTGAKKSAAKKPGEKKPQDRKSPERKAEKKAEAGKPADDSQLSFMGQMSFEDMLGTAAKAG